MRTRSDCEISKQRSRLLRSRQLYSGVVATSYEEATQDPDVQQLFVIHDSFPSITGSDLVANASELFD